MKRWMVPYKKAIRSAKPTKNKPVILLGIREDDTVVLGSHVGLDALTVLGACAATNQIPEEHFGK